MIPFHSPIKRKRQRLFKLLDAERARMLEQGHPCAANLFVGHMIRCAAGRYDYRIDEMILEARAA